MNCLFLKLELAAATNLHYLRSRQLLEHVRILDSNEPHDGEQADVERCRETGPHVRTPIKLCSNIYVSNDGSEARLKLLTSETVNIFSEVVQKSPRSVRRTEFFFELHLLCV